jgi:phage terminase small subunit
MVISEERDDLTYKQRLFVEFYLGEASGNATEAARLAGYRGNKNTLGSIGVENLRKPAVKRALENGLDVKKKESIATREEIMEFWTEAVRDKSLAFGNRCRAAENIAKAYAMFVQKLEVNDLRDKTREAVSGLLNMSPDRLAWILDKVRNEISVDRTTDA